MKHAGSLLIGSRITEISAAIDQGLVSPVELTQASIERAEASSSDYNAFTLLAQDRALRLARAAEERARAGARLGDLDGIPIAIKDMVDVRGLPTSNGSGPAWRSWPARSAAVVDNLERTGAVIIGKTTPHELGVGIDNNNPHYGATRNPWMRERSPGGSSGGSAAAVALGIVAGAVGTDTGGSIRIPASACGIFGLKGTFGHLPTEGVTPIAWSLDHVGPMAAHADDLELLFRAMADGQLPPADRSARAGLKGLRIGVPNRYFNERIQRSVANAYEAALRAFEEQGAIVEAVDLPSCSDAVADAFILSQVEAAYAHRDRIPQHLGELGDDARAFLQIGQSVMALAFVDAVQRQARFRRAMDAVFATIDILVVPATPAPAQPIGASEVRFGDEVEPLFNCMIRYTSVFNVSGHPALATPCPIGAEGLPTGIQIVGPMGSEHWLLGIAARYEESALAEHNARLHALRSASG
ncbi:amidase [Microvirga massiliensis]|uniref:amidase n=1 Tax=Microvirga massiliensis TaxID=1033741 RepID=UPI00062BB503|nr:amidase [Microvirga massiliensis]